MSDGSVISDNYYYENLGWANSKTKSYRSTAPSLGSYSYYLPYDLRTQKPMNAASFISIFGNVNLAPESLNMTVMKQISNFNDI